MDKIKHIFFDLDHTLWDFEKNSTEALLELYPLYDLGKIIPDSNDFMRTYKQINRKYWALYNHGKVNKVEVRVNRFIDTFMHYTGQPYKDLSNELSLAYLERSPYKKNLFPDTHTTLNYLQQKYKLHIITNGFIEVQHLKLNNCNLSQYFDVILCAEEVGKNKPHPEIYAMGLEKAMANANESIMIGDNLETDIIGAQNAGLDAIFFNPYNEQVGVETKQINRLSELQNLL